MKKLLATFLTLVIAAGLLVIPVKADCVGQYGQYGQYGQPCNSYSVVVDKMVGIPGNSTDATSYQYVDNLSVSDSRFVPSQFVFFKINIKNTSNTTLDDVSAKDYVPQYLSPVSGPGSFDSSTRTISWDAGSFNVDEQKTYYFKMQVASQADLPSDKGLFCTTNQAQVWSANVSNTDSSQLCIEKQVLGAAKVPSTGPEFGLALMAGEMALAGAGIYLKKRG